MITVQETVEKTLNTPAEIAEHLRARYDAMTARIKFAPGDAVTFANRAGLPLGYGIGEVGVVVADMPHEGFTHVLMLNSVGASIILQVVTDNLEKTA